MGSRQPGTGNGWDYALAGIDLQRKIAAAFKVTMHERSVGKLLHRLGFRHISVRPRHPQAEAAAQAAHKKTLPRWSLRARSGGS
jgi:hypothetical protein